MTFADYIRQATALSRNRGEILTLGHLYVVVLGDLGAATTPAHTAAAKRICEEILAQPQLQRSARGATSLGDVATFAWQDAERSFNQYSSEQGDRGGEVSAVAILQWLLRVGFEDVAQNPCRELCRRAGVVGAAAPNAAPVVPELGFGSPLAPPGSQQAAPQLAFGRDAELAKHLGFLTLALQQQSHYLLSGKPGVGKSFFLSQLLLRAQQAGHAAAGRQFVIFNREDFLGSEDENQERFGRLYSYLNQAPQVVPVFDGLEHILRHAPNLADHFAARFGSRLAGGGRTFILVCESSVAVGTEILKGIRPCPLPPLPLADTRTLLVQGLLPSLSQAYGVQAGPSNEEFADALLHAAAGQYPGRFMPELAIHVAESAFNSAKNRSEFLRQAPHGVVTAEDVWGHIVAEQGLNQEVFGKDPEEFYSNLRERLVNRVIGQDHAVNQVTAVLEKQAQRPPQREPRGRFLFVGPPGVGKTELARSLARELGFGEEAFFVFNMSEYSSETARTRFMGADPGYVGYTATRTIYQCVRERPACVILLDEIDRADATIQDILLSIMEGEGSDSTGQPVYFSQAVIVMTTNLGQEAVQHAYRSVTEGKATRDQLASQFTDDQLRRLVLEGATDATEVAMQQDVDDQIEAAKERYRRAASLKEVERLAAIDAYAALKELRARLQRQVRTSPLDRALMDRIDFIFPFFPIKERHLLEKILELKLAAFDWRDCPSDVKSKILDRAIAEEESVRPLVRLVKKYLCPEPS